MINRINTIGTDIPLDYKNRVAILRERKIEDTIEKQSIPVYRDQDDYGCIAPPGDFKFEPVATNENGSWYGFEGCSRNFYKLMKEHPIYVDPVDAFSGRWMFCMSWFKGIFFFDWNPEYPYDHLAPYYEKYAMLSGIGAEAHFGGDYAIGLELGWGGLLKKIEKYRAENPGRDDFYDAEELVVKGVQLYMRNMIKGIEAAEKEETNPILKENLKQMAEADRWLVGNPPRTMREACQWICWFNMVSREYNRDGAGCQLDETLRPYYERDLAAGIITEEEAKYYIACLLLNDTHYYQLGGLSPAGKDMVTYFSYLILEAAEWVNSTCNLTVRVHENMDMKFLHKAVDYLFKNKRGWPRFSCDDALSKGFMKNGYTEELARQRVAVGCHWMSLPGLEYTMNDTVKVNNAKVFEIAFAEMMEGDGEKSIDALWEIYRKHQRIMIEKTAEGIDFHIRHQKFNQPELMLNLLCHGPLEKGLDMSNGGAQYYNMCIDGMGLATVADSFAALQQQIEIDQIFDWDTVYRHVKNNYAGTDGEYVRLALKSSPRYGGGNTLSDKWAVRLSDLLTKDVRDMNDYYPYIFIPGWFSWAATLIFGKPVGATPDGRHDGDALSHGANPNPGFRRDGAITAFSNTICDVQSGYGNTVPVQLEVDPGLARDDESVRKIVDYILTIFKKGATLLNINIIDEKQIMEANEDPSKYPDLVVRVTGFTAYFSLLTPEFRQLVVDRIAVA